MGHMEALPYNDALCERNVGSGHVSLSVHPQACRVHQAPWASPCQAVIPIFPKSHAEGGQGREMLLAEPC